MPVAPAPGYPVNVRVPATFARMYGTMLIAFIINTL